MRLLFLLITTVVAEECVPSNHQITSEPITLAPDGSVNTTSGVLSSASKVYCTQMAWGGGGGCSSWSRVGGMCYDKGNVKDPCPCSYSTDNCNGAACKCHMQGDTGVEVCYKQTAQCPTCEPGSFAVGCGCVLCKSGATYDSYIYNNAYGACGDNSKWICGPGSCQKCPVGHKCAGGNTPAVRCPVGVSYQPLSGQVECIPCACQNNEYIPRTLSVSGCGGAMGVTELCRPCDICSTHDDIPELSGPTQRCPPQDWDYGRGADGSCKPCVPCAAELYSQVDSDHNFCNLDATTCGQLFYKPLNTEPPDRQSFVPLNVGVGLMPFVSGWQRNVGRQHKPGNFMALPGFESLQGKKAVLPYYSPCQDTMPNAAFATGNTTLQTIMDERSNWPHDCNPHLTAHCNTGFYADIAQWSDVVGIPYMSSCVPCPPNSEGGGSAGCACKSGYASPEQLNTVLPLNPRHLYDTAACVNCATQVYILDRENRMQPEAMQCTRRCTGRQILAAPSVACADCPLPTQIPLPNRQACHICPAGTYSVSFPQGGIADQYWECRPCDNDPPTFSRLAGQTECTPKRNQCPDGQKLVINHDATMDHGCADCQAGCAADEMQIMHANATGTCNSQGQLYFGCLSMSSGIKAGFPLNTRFGYGSSNDLAMAHIQVEECLNLPPHASWVSYGQNLAGKQCYFACDYGIASDAYHQTAHDYIVLNRVDLLAFLPTSTAATFEATSVQYVSTFGYLADALPLSDWLVYVNMPTKTVCPECLTTMATNTFLMVDIPPPSDMCLGPAAASLLSTHCEKGFVYENGTVMPKCALLARLSMYKTEPQMSGNNTLVPSTYYVNPSCRSENVLLNAFQVPCTRHCLTERHTRAAAFAELQIPGSLLFTQMSWYAHSSLKHHNHH